MSRNSLSDRLLPLSLVMGPFLCSVDATALFTAMPVLARQLDTTLSLASLTFVLYTLMFAGLILPLGWLMDRTDCFRLLRIGYLLFGVGSLACMAVESIIPLCASRMLQGVGGAILYSVTPVLVRRAVPAAYQERNYSRNAVAAQLGILVGPPLGGLITTFWGWEWIFGLNLPLVILGILLIRGRTALPDRESARTPLDLSGALLSFLSCGFCIVTLNQGKELGWSSWPILLAASGCAVSLLLFVRRQLTTPHPLICLGLLSNGPYRTAVLTACTGVMAGGGLAFLYPFFLTQRAGLSVAQVGLFLAIEPTCSVLLGSCAVGVTARLGYLPVITGSMGVRLLAALFLAAISGMPLLVPVGVAFALAGASTGLQYGPLTSRIMTALPAERVGAGGALFSQSRLMSQMMGVLLFETLYSELHDPVVRGAVAPSGSDGGFRAVFLLAASLLLLAAALSRGLQEPEPLL